MEFASRVIRYLKNSFGIEAKVESGYKEAERLVLRIARKREWIQIMGYERGSKYYLSWAMHRKAATKYISSPCIKYVEFDVRNDLPTLSNGIRRSDDQTHIAIAKDQIESIDSDSSWKRFLDRKLWHLVLSDTDSVSIEWVINTINIFKGTPCSVDAGLHPPERVVCAQYRILRDTLLARQLKDVHSHHCQICGQTIAFQDGYCYSEAHHIRPLGTPHNGPDVAENIIVLCPNHHVMLDYGCINLSGHKIRQHPNHSVAKEFIEYHNIHIYRGKMNPNPSLNRTAE